VRHILDKMRLDWDKRARTNPWRYIASVRKNWTQEDFFRSGRQNVGEQVLSDMHNICQGRDPQQMRALEIGCGAGRLTRALAEVFGEVHGVDISREMIHLAQEALADKPNIVLHNNNGMDLSFLADASFDFAFSFIVFQHIPSVEIIENYVREVHRVLRPGALFKFQVQGGRGMNPQPGETWVGATLSDEDATQMAFRCGFEPRYRHGAAGQYFWLWYFKREPPVIRYLAAAEKYVAAHERTRRALRTLGPPAADDIAALQEAIDAETERESECRAARERLGPSVRSEGPAPR